MSRQTERDETDGADKGAEGAFHGDKADAGRGKGNELITIF